jgi:uncharacterized protein (AIM24 family)
MQQGSPHVPRTATGSLEVLAHERLVEASTPTMPPGGKGIICAEWGTERRPSHVRRKGVVRLDSSHGEEVAVEQDKWIVRSPMVASASHATCRPRS